MDDDDVTRAKEAAALRRLFKDGRHRQAEFGRRHGIGGQSMVSQYLHGKSPLNLQAAVNFARGLGVSISEFSPRLAALAVEGAASAAEAPAQPASLYGPTVTRLAKAAERLPVYQQEQLLAAAEAMGGPSGDRISLSMSIAPRPHTGSS